MITYSLNKKQYKKAVTEFIVKKMLAVIIFAACLAAAAIALTVIGVLYYRDISLLFYFDRALGKAAVSADFMSAAATVGVFCFITVKVNNSVDYFVDKHGDDAVYTVQLSQPLSELTVTVSSGNIYKLALKGIGKIVKLKHYYVIGSERGFLFVEKNAESEEFLKRLESIIRSE